MQRFCKCAHLAYGVRWMFPGSRKIGAAIEITTEFSIAVRTAVQTAASCWLLDPVLSCVAAPEVPGFTPTGAMGERVR